MVLRRNRNPKLLALGTLRPQLALPLVLPARPRLGHRPPRRPLLRHHLGRPPLRLRPPLPLPLVGPARLRHGPRRPALGPNALGHLQHRPLPPLGWRPGRLRNRGQELMALARGPGRDAGSRLRHDIAADLDALPRLLHAHRGSGPRLHRHHSGARHGAG